MRGLSMRWGLAVSGQGGTLAWPYWRRRCQPPWLFPLPSRLRPMDFKQEDLTALVERTMPFGKYAGRVLIDLPEPYLLWFTKKGFPKGELGRLMALALMLKMDGTENLLDPLRK